MTNRELMLVYQAVKAYAAEQPDPIFAKILRSYSNIATRRGLAEYLSMIEDGYHLPGWTIPGYEESRHGARPAPAVRRAGARTPDHLAAA